MKTALTIASILIGIVISFYLLSTLHVRHSKVDGQVMRAWYVRLPGTGNVYYPEDTVDLQPWVGSGLNGLEVRVDGDKNPEFEAGVALKALGLYSEYEHKEMSDGHWVLYRPAKTETYFTLTANYRISPYKPVEE